MTAPEPLITALAARPAGSTGLLVGFSGGLDSTALLHALANTPGALEEGLRAIHVHHGLHADADAWAAHCQSICDGLGVPMVLARVLVNDSSGLGLEGAARAARYAAFETVLTAGETLVLAHHRDDQAETVLLRLLRASGSTGLASMPALRPFALGALWRPWLALPREALLHYARSQGLRWIEDPSNTDETLNRNFLRARVLPLLASRWPQANAALARSAALLAEDAALIASETARHLAQVQGTEPHTLSVPMLMALAPGWRAHVLRAWVAGLGLPPLPGAAVDIIESNLLASRPDAAPVYRWGSAIARRWRNLLHAERYREALTTDWQAPWSGDEPLLLPTGDTLAIVAMGADIVGTGYVGAGMAAMQVAASSEIAVMPAPTTAGGTLPPMLVRARRGGERITLPGRQHSHSLKHVLQELGVPTWDRERLPLIFAVDGELLAIGDLAISARLALLLEKCDARLVWHSQARF